MLSCIGCKMNRMHTPTGQPRGGKVQEISNPDDHLRVNKLADCGKDGGARMRQPIVHRCLSRTATVTERTIRQNISGRDKHRQRSEDPVNTESRRKKFGLSLPAFRLSLADAISQVKSVLSVFLCTCVYVCVFMCVCACSHSALYVCLFNCFLQLC